jgi:hypothetical protein
MLIFSIATDGCRPFFNMIWEEAVVNALYRGERPSFPSHISFRALLEPLINEDNGSAMRCWADNPFERPKLQDLEVLFLSFERFIFVGRVKEYSHRTHSRERKSVGELKQLVTLLILIFYRLRVSTEAKIATILEVVRGKCLENLIVT